MAVGAHARADDEFDPESGWELDDDSVPSRAVDPIMETSVDEVARSFEVRAQYLEQLSDPVLSPTEDYVTRRTLQIEDQAIKWSNRRFQLECAHISRAVAQVRIQVFLMWLSALMVLGADLACVVLAFQQIDGLPGAARVAIGCAATGAGTAGAAAVAGRAARRARSATARLPRRARREDGAPARSSAEPDRRRRTTR